MHRRPCVYDSRLAADCQVAAARTCAQPHSPNIISYYGYYRGADGPGPVKNILDSSSRIVYSDNKIEAITEWA